MMQMPKNDDFPYTPYIFFFSFLSKNEKMSVFMYISREFFKKTLFLS